MTQRVREENPNFNLSNIPVPRFNGEINKKHLLLISGIQEEYYEKLNNEEVLRLTKVDLKRRKTASNGQLLVRDGHYVFEDVTVHNNCTAIVSRQRIGVPQAFKPKARDMFDYVDYVERKDKDGNTIEVRYVYIVPKACCRLLNQTALVLSVNKMHSYYSGCEITLKNGYTVRLYIIPYKVTEASRPYRILLTKTTIDYDEEINKLYSFWTKHDIIYDMSLTQMDDIVKDRENTAFLQYVPTLDLYERCDLTRTLADEKDTMSEIAEGLKEDV